MASMAPHEMKVPRRVARLSTFLLYHEWLGLGAFGVVILHVLPKAQGAKWEAPWLAVIMFSVLVVSGFVGRYAARTPGLRRSWRLFHIPYTVAFLVVILPHILKEGFK